MMMMLMIMMMLMMMMNYDDDNDYDDNDDDDNDDNVDDDEKDDEEKKRFKEHIQFLLWTLLGNNQTYESELNLVRIIIICPFTLYPQFSKVPKKIES